MHVWQAHWAARRTPYRGRTPQAIEGLEDCVNLEELWLGKNKITEIRGISHLTKLRKLDIQSNRLEKIQGLETLVDLEELYLGHNGISEICGLDTLSALMILDLTKNRLTEITGIHELHALTDLWVREVLYSALVA